MAQRYQTVDAVPSRPPVYSLLGVVRTIDDNHRFTEGIQWLPEWTGDGHVSAIDPDTGNVTTREGSIFDAMIAAAQQSADPILLWAGELASSLGSMGRDYEGRVRRKLAATESYQAAQELWDGAVGLAAGHAQNYLIDLASDRLTSSAVSITNALGAIEHGLAEELGGQVGMIHMTPQVLLHAVAADCVMNAGTPAAPLWLTPMGHVVVADAGYSGNGPGAVTEVADTSSQWIMGTDMVAARLGPVEMKPRSIATREAADYSDNDIIVLAQRLCLFQWNNNAHVAAEVNIGIAAIGGAS